MNQTIRLGFSSCPNDAFIFESIVNDRIDTCGCRFEVTVADVEKLNQMAMQSALDVTKVSFNAFLGLTDHYVMLDSGAALGRGVGPLLLSARPVDMDRRDALIVAIPGEHTTANFLLDYAFPGMKNKKVMLFSDIEDAVLKGEADLGLVIHESRFTYQKKGLHKIADLGSLWEEGTGSPIPLGGIVALRSLGSDVIMKINKLIRRSLEFSYANPATVWAYIKSLSQEMDDEVIRQHIALYVNAFTLSLGREGRKAVLEFFRQAERLGIIDGVPEQSKIVIS